MIRLSTTLAVAALAMPAHAEDYITANWQCSFTTECFETEACTETAYEVEVTYEISQLEGKPGEGAGTGEIIDQTATRRAAILHDTGAFIATGFDFEQDATITPEHFQVFAAEGGEARLISARPAAPMVITYHGQCKKAGS